VRGRPIESFAWLDELLLAARPQDRGSIPPQDEPEIGDKLGDVIAGEIVPRLMLLHARQAEHSAAARATPPAATTGGQIPDFAELIIRHDADVVEAYVRSLLQRGLDLETLLLHLLAPAARRLGLLWEADEITFVDVTIGTTRLQQLLRTFVLPRRDHEDDCARRALFLPTPDEQHTFGLLMVTEFFRREGWDVHSGIDMTANDLRALIAERNFVLIGFSLSCERLINSLRSTIQMARRSSRNPSVLIMVGGRIFAQDPSLRPWVGADLVATDAREALELAEGALRKTASGRGPRHI
jgi:methanogenic corrinoid protein MtbC1